MNIEEIAKLYEQRSRLQREHGYALVLVDTRAHGGVPPEARRYVAMRAPNPPIRGCVVIFGMSLLGRTALALILAAARRFGRSPTTDLQLVPDEAAAWALLASWRARSLSVAALRP
jgi:pimeloyl-ACP methyl ester carboxylesterase